MRVVALILLTLLPNTWAEGELAKQLDTARNRMRCLSDAECLNEKGVLRLLRVTDFPKNHSEDLSIVLAHHFLHGDSSCTVQLPSLGILEEEVMRAIETEGIPGILRNFKRILKDGEKQECITTDGILKEMPPSSSSFTAMQWLRSVLSILMEHVLTGHCIDDGSHSDDSLDTLFHRYGDPCSPFITARGLEKMMNDLENTGLAHSDHHHHHHNHHHHEGHNHEECDHDHHDTRNHDHDHRDPRNNDHDHDYSDKYHNHDHSSHNHENHGSSDQYHQKSYPSNHDHSDHSNHDHNDHSNHDHSKHNHGDSDNSYAHSAHDHNNHNNTDHDNSSHNHFDHDHSNHNHSNHDHGQSSLWKQIYHKDNENKHNHSNDDSHNLEVKVDSIILTNYHNGNYNDSLAPGNRTMEVESRYQTAIPENNSESIENVLSSKLSNLWYPTTLASEESNVISNVIPPLRTPTSSIATQCLSAESMVSLYGLDRITISKSEFLRLCPVIVQQTVGDACDEPHVSSKAPSKIEVYGYGSACVFVLCLASLSGVVLLPLMRRNARHYVIAGFQGLAFSTLASDALLHLLPEFLGLHSHDHSHSHFHEEASFPEPYAQLLLGFLATTYVLFMTEAVLCALSGRSTEQGGHGHSHVHHISEPTLISVKNKSITQLPLSGDQSCSSLNTEILDMDVVRKPPNLMVSQPVLCGLTSVALVVTLGDALHNFGDGLAIGAAFSANIRGGLSTAAAALCHELPHELGDFVVLLSTGLSFSRALVLNFLSGLTCFAGLYVGILVGDNEVARKWVMAVTASTFLYVALAEMVPELREHRYGSPFKMLLVKNIGIIVGITLMCVISVYEHEMV